MLDLQVTRSLHHKTSLCQALITFYQIHQHTWRRAYIKYKRTNNPCSTLLWFSWFIITFKTNMTSRASLLAQHVASHGCGSFYLSLQIHLQLDTLHCWATENESDKSRCDYFRKFLEDLIFPSFTSLSSGPCSFSREYIHIWVVWAYLL